MYICMYVCMNEWMNEWMNVRTYVCIWSWLMCRSCSYWTCLFVLRQPESSDNQRGISSMLNPSDSQDYKHGEQWTDLFPDFSLAGLQNWDIHQQQWVQSGKGTAIDLNWFPVKRGGGLSSQPYVLTKWQFWSDMNILKKVRLDMKRRYQTTVLFSQPYIGLRLTQSSTTHLGGLPSEESNSVKHVVGRSSLSKQELLQHRKLLLLYSFKGLKFSA